MTDPSTTLGSDPSGSTGATYDTAVEAARAGAADARKAAENFIPAAGRAISKGIYASAFGLSFGVTFPIFLVSRVIPKNNPVVHGLVDGAHAAADLARESREASAARSGNSGPAALLPT